MLPIRSIPLMALSLIGVAGGASQSSAASFSPDFVLKGDIGTPGTYDYASLSALPPTKQTVTYTSAGTPVTNTFTGTNVWTLLNSAGCIIPIPNVKNSSLLNYVV